MCPRLGGVQDAKRPRLAPFNNEKYRLYSKPLPNDWAPYLISKGELSRPLKPITRSHSSFFWSLPRARSHRWGCEHSSTSKSTASLFSPRATATAPASLLAPHQSVCQSPAPPSPCLGTTPPLGAPIRPDPEWALHLYLASHLEVLILIPTVLTSDLEPFCCEFHATFSWSQHSQIVHKTQRWDPEPTNAEMLRNLAVPRNSVHRKSKSLHLTN